MVTLTLRDDDATALYADLGKRSKWPEVAWEDRVYKELKCALLVCECGAPSSVGRAGEGAGADHPQGEASQ